MYNKFEKIFLNKTLPVKIENLSFFNIPQSNILLYYFYLYYIISPEWYEWDIDTIQELIKRKKQIHLNSFDTNKINALKLTFCDNNSIWSDFNVFEKTGITFNNYIPNFNYYQKMSPEEILVFIKLLNVLNKKKIEDEVLSYMAVSCYENGLIFAPEELGICQNKLNFLLYMDDDKIKKINSEIERNLLENTASENEMVSEQILKCKNIINYSNIFLNEIERIL